MATTVRVRFAPSPTGNLHIGGARTALFNWLFAKSQGGQFILRIEDTDIVRSKKEYLDEIVRSLSWLGMAWDELYHQGERFAIYREYAQKLLDQGRAYVQKKEDASGEEAGEGIIFRVTRQTVTVQDLIRGEITFDAETIKDQVLIKSDGTPSYNFACVVDDALMRITHVIRGDDHISNTPKQILLYEALGFALPQFAHLPLILDEAGGRLSKRTGATAVSEYRSLGYLPEAIMNFLVLLGWSPGGNQEIVTPESAAKKFSLKHVNKTGAIFDIDKLNWINNYYIKQCPLERLTAEMIPLLREKGFIGEDYDRNYLASLLQLYKDRMNTLRDFIERADFFFTDDLVFDPAVRAEVLSRDFSREFALLCERLQKLLQFDAAGIEAAFRALVAELGLKPRELVHPVRFVLTAKTVGPGLFETMAALGREKVQARLLRFSR